MFFPSSWTSLSPCSVSLCHPPLSSIPLFIFLSPSLAQTPRQLVSGELNIDLAGLSMPGEWASVHQRPRHQQPAIDVFRGQNRGGGVGRGSVLRGGGEERSMTRLRLAPRSLWGPLGPLQSSPLTAADLFLSPFKSVLFCFSLLFFFLHPTVSSCHI